MTTPIPTSNGVSGLAAPSLPDEAALQAWANTFFSTLPGNAPALPESFPLNIDLPESSVGEDRVTAQSFGLPGIDTLQALLNDIDAGAVRENAVPSVPGAGNFYFLDPIQPQLASVVPQIPADAHPAFDVQTLRRDFPILAERVNGRPLVWLDNAATTQKPKAVIDRLAYFYEHENSNIHRAAHELAARATDAYEAARQTVARFIGAGSVDEIVFVRGATEAINLVAQSWGAQNIGEGDEIVISHLEHHANIVPWQQLATAKGARLRVIPVDDSGQILLDEYRRLLNDRTKIVAITQVSNALGTVTPVQEVVQMAHSVGAKALVDGAQSVSHMRVNVQALDADFFVFSGHKIFGPTGIGVVYGKKEILESMPPWQGGGNMIVDVTFEKTLYHGAPARFEAGTGNIADAAGLGAALDYIERVGLENIARYEHDLLAYATEGFKTISGLRLIGTARDKASVLSFVLEGYHVEEVGKALNSEGIAVRSGHHCAQPILRRFGVEATVRPSLAFYNTCEEVDQLLSVLRRLRANRHNGA
jgi:cysteine desulfurase/selenocysteine lyase